MRPVRRQARYGKSDDAVEITTTALEASNKILSLSNDDIYSLLVKSFRHSYEFMFQFLTPSTNQIWSLDGAIA